MSHANDMVADYLEYVLSAEPCGEKSMKLDNRVGVITNSSTSIYSYAESSRIQKICEILGMDYLIVPREDHVWEFSDYQISLLLTKGQCTLGENRILYPQDIKELDMDKLREFYNEFINFMPSNHYDISTETFAMFYKDGIYQEELSLAISGAYDHDAVYG